MSLCLITTPQTLVIRVIDYGSECEDGIYDTIGVILVAIEK